jgi:hypothetical protein
LNVFHDDGGNGGVEDDDGGSGGVEDDDAVGGSNEEDDTMVLVVKKMVWIIFSRVAKGLGFWPE